MIQIGVQTKNVVYDNHPEEGFSILKKLDLPVQISV